MAQKNENCWEFKNCIKPIKEACPAFINRQGKDCWKVTGTKCDGGNLEMLSVSEKLAHCREKCLFYKNKHAHQF